MRTNILSQILLPAAQDRLKRLQLVRPEKVRAVEDSLLMAAKSGKLKEKVSEEQLIQFLGQLDGTIDAEGAPKVSVYELMKTRHRFHLICPTLLFLHLILHLHIHFI